MVKLWLYDFKILDFICNLGIRHFQLTSQENIVTRNAIKYFKTLQLAAPSEELGNTITSGFPLLPLWVKSFYLSHALVKRGRMFAILGQILWSSVCTFIFDYVFGQFLFKGLTLQVHTGIENPSFSLYWSREITSVYTSLLAGLTGTLDGLSAGGAHRKLCRVIVQGNEDLPSSCVLWGLDDI